MEKGCRTPSVQNCLHCTRPDCDAPLRVKPDISELYALVRVGMIAPRAIDAHIRTKGRKFGKAVKHK